MVSKYPICHLGIHAHDFFWRRIAVAVESSAIGCTSAFSSGLGCGELAEGKAHRFELGYVPGKDQTCSVLQNLVDSDMKKGCQLKNGIQGMVVLRAGNSGSRGTTMTMRVNHQAKGGGWFKIRKALHVGPG